MPVTSPGQIDGDRVEELTRVELERLNARTALAPSRPCTSAPAQSLSGGVASSYQLRDPWPIYLVDGDGPRVTDVDGNTYWDFHNGFGSMVQGHAHPGDHRGRARARSARHALRGGHRGHDRRRRGARRALRARRAGGSSTRARRRRWTRSGSRAALTGRDTVMKIFGSYHGHHDAVMVSIGVPYDQIGDREELRLAALRRRHPEGRQRHDDRRAVQRRRCDGAPDRAA